MGSAAERLLVLDTYGGLGNRLKPVVSGVRWAERTDRRLVYRWARDRLFRALPRDLWVDFPSPAGIIAFGRARIGAIRVDPWNVGKHPEASRLSVRHHDPLEEFEGQTPWRSDLRSYTPVPSIHDRASQILARLDERPLRVGVMVRAHRRASDVTKQTSPAGWFVDRLSEVRGVLGDEAAVYLSCDDRQTERQIHEQFSNLVSTPKHGYNSREGVQDAVVDLYGLGACDLLFGPDGSTFIHLAEYFADGQTKVLTPSTQAGVHHLERLRDQRPTRIPYPWR